jgi:hypothetical protein
MNGYQPIIPALRKAACTPRLLLTCITRQISSMAPALHEREPHVRWLAEN